MGIREEQAAMNNGVDANTNSTSQPQQAASFKIRGVVGLLNPTELSDRNAAASVKGYISGDKNRY